MLIALYIFFGFLLFDCLVAGCIYFLKDRLFKQHEGPLNNLKTVKSNKYVKSRLASNFVH